MGSILDAFLGKVKNFDPFPVLYSRTNTGAIQTWKVEVDGNKYRFITGQKNSPNMVTSEWTVCQGKNVGKANETTGDEQALKEAKSAQAKKLKSCGYWEHECDIDKTKFFAPMLAKKWVEHKHRADWSKGVYISPKMDGLRCVINREGAFSRLGNRFVAFPHIYRELQHLFVEDPDLVLDGECYTHALKHDFDKIISLAKQQKPTPEDIKESEKYLEYWIFDCPTAPGGYHERYQWLKKNIQERFRGNRWIKLCEHRLITREADLDVALGDYIQEGFEGIMINLYDGGYESDKRSHNILKYKLFQDEEFEIVDIFPGDGNRSGMFGRAIMKMPDGRTFKSSAKGNEEFYIRLLKERKDLIGKKATIRFQNFTPDGIPRFGTIIAIRDYE